MMTYIILVNIVLVSVTYLFTGKRLPVWEPLNKTKQIIVKND